MDQIATVNMLETKSRYGVKNRNNFVIYPFFFKVQVRYFCQNKIQKKKKHFSEIMSYIITFVYEHVRK